MGEYFMSLSESPNAWEELAKAAKAWKGLNELEDNQWSSTYVLPTLKQCCESLTNALRVAPSTEEDPGFWSLTGKILKGTTQPSASKLKIEAMLKRMKNAFPESPVLKRLSAMTEKILMATTPSSEDRMGPMDGLDKIMVKAEDGFEGTSWAEMKKRMNYVYPDSPLQEEATSRISAMQDQIQNNYAEAKEIFDASQGRSLF
jgi:hypothetical protein